MDETEIKFSILMANYNNGPFIGEAIKSVLSQTYDNWELIIVDDASTDNSIEVIGQYTKNNKVKLYQHKEHLGCGATKKDCAKYATGEIFGELDSDDMLDKNAIKEVAAEYGDQNISFVYTNYLAGDKDLKKLEMNNWVGKMEKGDTNLRKPLVSNFRTYRKEAYVKTEGYDADLKKAVDKDLIYKMEEVANFKFLNKPLYYYRIHNNNISTGNKIYEAYLFDVLARLKAYRRRLDTNIVNLSAKEMSDQLYWALPICLKEKKLNFFKFFLQQAFVIFPLNFKAWSILAIRSIKFLPYRIYKKLQI